MNIIQIIPGSGGSFYCGNCLRDSKFFDALRGQKHDVIKIPMYLPLFSDEHDLTSDVPVFYGAVSLYLKQQYAFFRHMPRWVDKLLDSKPMLKLAASQAGSTRADGLEEMTISMLMGEKGLQRDELERMIGWIGEYCKPDVVHLSNALLLGLAEPIRQKLNAKVVCSLQDEDVWVDGMNEHYRQKVWKLMAEKAEAVDLFVAVSDYYAQVSIDRMQLPETKIRTIHLGVDPADYRIKPISEKKRTIGYISRTCHENGLDILVDAFILLKEQKGFEDVKLLITGGSTNDDVQYIKEQKLMISSYGLENHVEFLDEFEGEARLDFFDRVSCISVPIRNGEAFGIYLTEAMASGVPIVQPPLGAFPEIVARSNGGVIYDENTPKSLALALSDLLADQNKLSELSENAVASVQRDFNIHQLAKDLTEAYEGLF